MASCVEAIGGKTRIVGGDCENGHHAWAEVLIGNKSDWEATGQRIISYMKLRKGHKISASMDEEGNFWLPLDWELGRYTCNDNPNQLRKLYPEKTNDNLQILFKK